MGMADVCRVAMSQLGLSLVQSSKRSHMHLSSTSAGLHYPVAPCHYGNQQTTYGMMAAQEMLSASISQTRILQTCSVPHPNMVNGANSLQGEPLSSKDLGKLRSPSHPDIDHPFRP
ncbi:pituitary-specific positive transcription factor 1-like [Arapaima gigas]